MDRIFVGSLEAPLFFFNDDSIESVTTAQAVALLQQELSIDTLTAVVRDDTADALNVTLFVSSDGKAIQLSNGQILALDVTASADPSPIIEIPDGTPVWYYHSDELVGRFYLESVKRPSTNKYQLNCVSAVGRLDKTQHGGGLYLQTTFGQVMEDLMTVAAEE